MVKEPVNPKTFLFWLFVLSWNYIYFFYATLKKHLISLGEIQRTNMSP